MPISRIATVRTSIVAATFSLATLTTSASFAADAPARPANANANAAAKKPGTAKPIVGDMIDGTNIRKKPSTPKPVIGDILEGTNIRKQPGAGGPKAKANPKPGNGQRRVDSPRDSQSGLATGK
ncbi:MAG: hypothetical protein JNL19_03810 [Burkholderiales bacterium]|nr:hypothetical protein [Burkholderiales bacterium]